ncbi:Type II secretory pathway component [Pseudomonas sp. GCM10022188]|uniref:Type II secretory pathway component n=1 Tax=Pseudomonas TaxID=286 RepID=UPI001E5F4B66|nr:Type II secretory pathway component [Pseudomonas oryzagri]MCC6077586.1 Type II secretory pathway component [Pseudomonas oryzagri]
MSRALLLILAAAWPLAAAAVSDPTLPPTFAAAPVAGAEVAPAPLLQAILRGPAGARAVIGGQSLKVGERLGELRVLAIRARSVLIERQGQRSELHLSQPIVTPAIRSPSR